MSSILKTLSVFKTSGTTHQMTQHHNTAKRGCTEKRILHVIENALLYDAGICCCCIVWHRKHDRLWSNMCIILFATIDLTLLRHHSCQIKNISYDSSSFDGFVKEQFIQELGISQEWILGIVLHLIITFIGGLIRYMWWYWRLLWAGLA